MTAVGDRIALDAPAIAATDSSDQLGVVLDLPRQLLDAHVRCRASRATPVDAAGGLIVAGMGGSAVGGRLALGVLGPQLSRPLVVSDGYRLPAWAGPATLVLCSSYSGGTEETLAAYDDAGRRGAPRIVATTGGPLAERARRDGVPVIALPPGLQPRAAVAYSLIAALHAAALAGAAPASQQREIDAAAALVADLLVQWGPGAGEAAEAKRLARVLHGTIPVIAGADLTAPVAYRWKCQFNENTGVPAFASLLPEADHNEVVGWDAAKEGGQLAYVSLEDPDAHPRLALRAALTASLAEAGAACVTRVSASGETRLQRLLSLVVLGDLVSIYAAVLRGTDPVAIPAIDELKAQLSLAA